MDRTQQKRISRIARHLCRGGLCLLLGLSVPGLRAQTDALVHKSDLARQAMGAGRYSEAATLYRELVRALPTNSGLRLNLGLALESAGEYRQAIEQLQIAVRQQPESAPAWLVLGMAYQKLGQPAEALAPLAKALKIDPANQMGRFELADAYLAAGHAAEAATHFRKLLETEPQNPKGWQGLGLSYVVLSRDSFAQLEKLAPGSAFWCFLAARSALGRDQFRTAFNFYRQALKHDPGLRGVHAGLAQVYRQTGHADWAAIEDEREAQIPKPDCGARSLACEFLAGHFEEVVDRAGSLRTPEGFFLRSRAYQEMSLQAFSQLGRMPPTAEIHELMARAHLTQSQYRSAALEWEEALKLAPSDRRLQKQLAQAWWLDHDYARARSLLETLLNVSPHDPDLNFEFGDIQLQQESPEKAIPYLEKAVRRSPQLVPARAGLARAYLRLGRPNDAVMQLKAALATSSDAQLFYQLAQAYQQAGQTALAKQTMRKFQEASSFGKARQSQASAESEITPP